MDESEQMYVHLFYWFLDLRPLFFIFAVQELANG